MTSWFTNKLFPTNQNGGLNTNSVCVHKLTEIRGLVSPPQFVCRNMTLDGYRKEEFLPIKF